MMAVLGIPLSFTKKDFSYMRHLNVQKLKKKCNICIFMFLKNDSGPNGFISQVPKLIYRFFFLGKDPVRGTNH